MRKMKISDQLNGTMYKVSFGYNSNLEGYATLMSDIPRLGEIALLYDMWRLR
jgi:hypothetical protein